MTKTIFEELREKFQKGTATAEEKSDLQDYLKKRVAQLEKKEAEGQKAELTELLKEVSEDEDVKDSDEENSDEESGEGSEDASEDESGEDDEKSTAKAGEKTSNKTSKVFNLSEKQFNRLIGDGAVAGGVKMSEKDIQAEGKAMANTFLRKAILSEGSFGKIAEGGQKDVRVIATSSNNDASGTVQQSIVNKIFTIDERVGAMLNDMYRFTTSGNSVPKNTLGNATASRIAEGATGGTADNNTPALAKSETTITKMKVSAQFSRESIMDSVFDLEADFVRKFRIASTKLLETEFIAAVAAATGTNAAKTTDLGSAANIDDARPNHVLQLLSLIKRQDGQKKLYMNETLLNYFQGMVDSQNRPIFTYVPSGNNAGVLNGAPVVTTDAFSDATTLLGLTTSHNILLAGDLSQQIYATVNNGSYLTSEYDQNTDTYSVCLWNRALVITNFTNELAFLRGREA